MQMDEKAEGGGEGEERVGDKGLVSAVSARLLLITMPRRS